MNIVDDNLVLVLNFCHQAIISLTITKRVLQFPIEFAVNQL